MFNRNKFEKLCEKAQKQLEKKQYHKAKDTYLECLSIKPDDIGVLNNLAQLYSMIGDYGKSDGYNEILLNECNEQLKYGESEQLLIFKSNALVSLKRRKEALESIDKLLAISPDHIIGLIHKAQYLESTGEFEKALPYINRILKNDPSNIAALLSKGRLYCKLHEYDKAERCYNYVFEIETKNKVAISLKSKLLKMKYDITQTPHDFMLKAIEQWEMNDFEASEDYFKKAIDMDSDYDEIWFAQGELFIRMGKLGRAIDSFNRAFELNPKSGGIVEKKGFYKMLNRMLKINKLLGYEKE